MAPVKTMTGIFRALSFVLHQLWLAAQAPRTAKLARWNLWSWGVVSAIAAFALVTDAAAAVTSTGTWWSWWYLWNGTVLGLDLIMLRAALVGYFYRKTKDAEKEEFERIVANL